MCWNGTFWTFKMPEIDFTENLSRRKSWNFHIVFENFLTNQILRGIKQFKASKIDSFTVIDVQKMTKSIPRNFSWISTSSLKCIWKKVVAENIFSFFKSLFFSEKRPRTKQTCRLLLLKAPFDKTSL